MFDLFVEIMCKIRGEHFSFEKNGARRPWGDWGKGPRAADGVRTSVVDEENNKDLRIWPCHR